MILTSLNDWNESKGNHAKRIREKRAFKAVTFGRKTAFCLNVCSTFLLRFCPCGP